MVAAHTAHFADGSGVLFDAELQVLAVLQREAAVRVHTGREIESHGTKHKGPEWILHCRAPSVAQLLAALGPDKCRQQHARATDAHRRIQATIEVAATRGGYSVSGSHVTSECRRRDELLPLVKAVLTAELIGEGALAIHAAAARWRGRWLLLPGSPGSGKSTLCAAILRSGFDFVADDVLLLHQGVVHGLSLPLAIKEPGWEVLGSFHPEIATLPAHRRPDGVWVKYLPRTSAPEPTRVGWAVFPHYGQGRELRIERIDQSIAFRRVIAEAYSTAHRLHPRDFHALAHWMRNAQCFDLHYGCLADAVRAVETITRTPSAPACFAAAPVPGGDGE